MRERLRLKPVFTVDRRALRLKRLASICFSEVVWGCSFFGHGVPRRGEEIGAPGVGMRQESRITVQRESEIAGNGKYLSKL